MNKTVPVVAIHYNGMEKDTWLMVMHSEDFAEYALGDRIAGGSTFTDPKAKYAVDGLLRACRVVLKHFDV